MPQITGGVFATESIFFNHHLSCARNMDPLSVSAAVASLVFTLVKPGRQLQTIFESFQEAQHSLFIIRTECTVLAAALSQIQIIFSRDRHERGRDVPKAVLDALELSLIGCTMTLSVLTEDVGRIVRDIDLAKTLGRKQKAK
jgi:hypothetical protein